MVFWDWAAAQSKLEDLYKGPLHPCSSHGKLRGVIGSIAAIPCLPCFPIPRSLGRNTPRVVVALPSGVVRAAHQPSAQGHLIHGLDLHSLKEFSPSLLGRKESTTSLLQGNH